MSKTIIITGGAGYIGKPTAYRLLQLGYRVVVYDLASTSTPTASITYIIGDILDKPQLLSAMKTVQPDVVIHLAALISVSESELEYNHASYEAVNVIGVQNVLSAMKFVGCKSIIFASSAAVYKDSTEPLREESLVEPTSFYGKTKELAERAIQNESSIHSIIFRYFNVSGSTADGMFGEALEGNPKLIPSALRVGLGRDATLFLYGNAYPTKDGTAIRDYVSLEDVVCANVKAVSYVLSHRTSLTYNIGSGRGTSNMEVVHAVEKFLGKKIPTAYRPARKETIISVSDIKRAKKVLQWEPSFSDVNDIIRGFSSAHYIQG